MGLINQQCLYSFEQNSFLFFHSMLVLWFQVYSSQLYLWVGCQLVQYEFHSWAVICPHFMLPDILVQIFTAIEQSNLAPEKLFKSLRYASEVKSSKFGRDLLSQACSLTSTLNSTCQELESSGYTVIFLSTLWHSAHSLSVIFVTLLCLISWH